MNGSYNTAAAEPPADGAPAVARPRRVTLVQAAVVLVAIAPAALVSLLLLRIDALMEVRAGWNAMGLDAGAAQGSALDLARTEFAWEFAIVLAVPSALILLAFITAVGLQWRRRWARVLGATWSGVLLLPLAAWASGCAILLLTVAPPTGRGYDVGPLNPFELNALAAAVALAADLLVFLALLSRRTRQWAPRRQDAPLAPQLPSGQVPQ